MQHHHHLLLLLVFTTTTTLLLSPCNTKATSSVLLQRSSRRSLHQPLFPVPTPSPPPVVLPKYPFSTDPPPFFPFTPSTPSTPSSPPPPSHPRVTQPILPSIPNPTTTTITTTTTTTSSSSPTTKPTHSKLAIAIALPLTSLLLLIVLSLAFFLYRHRPKSPENHRILSGPSSSSCPPKTSTSLAPQFLHLGNTGNARSSNTEVPTSVGSPYQRLNSPELHPLPPLHRSRREGGGYDSDEEFYSPGGSSSSKDGSDALLGKQGSSSRRLFGASRSSNRFSRSCLSSDSLCSSPNQSPERFMVKSLSSGSDHMELHPTTPPPPPPPPPVKQVSVSGSPTIMPPPPPPPPVGYWEHKIQSEKAKNGTIPAFPVELPEVAGGAGTGLDVPRPKLKPLHWDKVRASSDRAMVWDQLKSSSFRVNEEMMETLFVCNAASTTAKEKVQWLSARPPTEEERVLDPKKAQNIAILLRALNVTKEEVSEALLEGSTENMGTELLETLLKMAPSREEEVKLREYRDGSPCKLGPAEKFLKAVIDVPFAFKRVESMLYIASFDSEISYLTSSFQTLELACEELRNSRMFLKLLEAVLKTGNRMNVGTNRGDARAFKLDTLLKLVDVKGTDGKTTLLHFVVQEITKAEGSRLSSTNQASYNFPDDRGVKKIGLQVVSGLSGELDNVKKAAAMDSDMLSSYVSKLASGIRKINEVIMLNSSLETQEKKSQHFHEAMCSFLTRAEDGIVKIQAQESVALSLVKEITEYFHGNSAKEEAHPFRIFMVVRDFLSILDRVCKEVGETDEQGAVGLGMRIFPVPTNPNTMPPLFPKFQEERVIGSSSEGEDSSASC